MNEKFHNEDCPSQGAIMDGDKVVGVFVEIPPEQYTSGLRASLAMIDRSDGRNLSIFNAMYLDDGIPVSLIVSHIGEHATQDDIIRTYKFARRAIVMAGMDD